jgi:hypothetical protein
MKLKSLLRSYTAFSILAGIVLVALFELSQLDAADRRDHFFLVFLGIALGWLAATFARYVYPPPKRYRQRADPEV